MSKNYQIWIDQYEDFVVMELNQEEYRPVIGYGNLSEALNEYPTAVLKEDKRYTWEY